MTYSESWERVGTLAVKKKKRTRLIPKLILLAFVLYSAVTLVSLQFQINRQKDNIDSLAGQIEQEEAKQTQLNQLLQEEVDDAYIISEAQKQGYATTDERVFVDISN